MFLARVSSAVFRSVAVYLLLLLLSDCSVTVAFRKEVSGSVMRNFCDISWRLDVVYAVDTNIVSNFTPAKVAVAVRWCRACDLDPGEDVSE